MKPREKKPFTRPEALEKLKTYCAYQERSKRQVIQKMRLLGLEKDWDEELLLDLMAANYLNQERYAESFAKGKSRAKGWGTQKIVQRLGFELGKDFNADIHLEGVDEEAARKKLIRDMEKKRDVLEKKGDKELKNKLIRFCLSRGFGLDDSLSMLKTELGL